jgi:hypothetical protein
MARTVRSVRVVEPFAAIDRFRRGVVLISVRCRRRGSLILGGRLEGLVTVRGRCGR